MNKIAKILAMLTMVSLAACAPENEETIIERDVFYTVANDEAFSGLSGKTIHLRTESEWEALLDRFCDYVKDGNQVLFCSTHPGQPQSKRGDTKDTPTSITTTDRNEIKVWMKEMEKIGKTVNITYDGDTGTWSGRAYVNIGQEDMRESQTYSGTLVFVPTPVLEEPPLGGRVWAMQVNADSTLILSVYGMMMWNSSDTLTNEMSLLQGAGLVFDGVARTHTDLQGHSFMTLTLNMVENKN